MTQVNKYPFSLSPKECESDISSRSISLPNKGVECLPGEKICLEHTEIFINGEPKELILIIWFNKDNSYGEEPDNWIIQYADEKYEYPRYLICDYFHEAVSYFFHLKNKYSDD